MRNQPFPRASSSSARVALFAVLLSAWACSDPQPTPNTTPDFAGGVDAEFGVETFALGVAPPTLTIVSPQEGWAYTHDYAGAAKVITAKIDFKVDNFTLGAATGQVICHVDGGQAFTATTLTVNSPDLGISKGMRTIACNLAKANGELVTDSSAHAVVHVQVTQDKLADDKPNVCALASECDDGKACSSDACVNFKCEYKAVPGCCGSSDQCIASLNCIDPGATTSKCSSCSADGDCDDGQSCTVDKCDLSGLVGKCSNTKSSPDACCSAADPCDDGKACTVDSCDVAAQKCKHVQPEGTCCTDEECKVEDVCLKGSCVDMECRYGPDTFKPDCCSTTFNPKCDDKKYCTLDKCEVTKDGWTQCSHKPDPIKNAAGTCCEMTTGTSIECDDGNDCTWDICTNWLCEHKPNAECCAIDADCDDGNGCTIDSCTVPQGAKSGDCKHDKIPECCNDNPDCDDNKWCTLDACNVPTNTCKHTSQYEGCCETSEQCDDGKFCTADVCVTHVCVHGPDTFKPNCCESNDVCNDKDPCTLDTCDTATKTCKFVSNGDPNCCAVSLDCDDGDCTTLDFCDGFNQCKVVPNPEQCKANADCDDGNPATIDTCNTTGACGKCEHAQDPSFCSADFECDDSKGTNPNPKAACTADKCVDGKCQNTAIANCCTGDLDAKTVCDDKNGCTIEYCINNECRHTVPKNGCCASAKDCNDGDKCTTDSCDLSGGGATGSCKNVLEPACKCSVEGALAGLECNDNNKCTTDACTGGLCTHGVVPGCCLDQFDCDDGQPCTFDYCVFNECVHSLTEGSDQLCCTKETQDVDCAYLNAECAKGVCVDQPDGSRKCEAQAVPVCTVNIGYCQDFSGAGKTLPQMGWNPADVKAGAGKNWKPASDNGLGPDQHARLDWTPTATEFETCLASPIIQAAGAKTITVQFDQEFLWNAEKTNVVIKGSLDGENVDWKTATIIDTKAMGGTVGPETLDIKLPPELTGSNGLRLGFCVSGTTTFNFSAYSVDNVCVVKGSKPAFPKCPANQIVPLNSKKTVPVKAIDPDADAILSFKIVDGPEFVSLSSALYYWLDTSWNSTLTINPTKLTHIGTHKVTIKVSDGSLYSLCTFNITVTYQGGYLVWRPSEVPEAMGNALYDALKKQGKTVQHITDLSLYPDLTGFTAIFVSLGVYPANHVLTEDEGAQLALYLSTAPTVARVYLEGGETWAFDPPTSLHSLFKVQPLQDSTVDGITGPLKTGGKYSGFYYDISGDPAHDYAFEYDQGSDYNNLNDDIGAKSVHRTKTVLYSKGTTEKPGVQVGHAADNGYRTVASSILFAGVLPGASDSADDMMKRILFFFENGFKDCYNAADCNDNDDCTADTCTDGECFNKQTCSCQSAGTATCGGSTTMVSNGTSSTKQVKQYGCDPGVDYLGKELAIKYVATASQPVTVKVTNLTNPKAKVFVLKAPSPDNCDSSQCIASGTGTFSFAGAKDQQYFIVIDTQVETEAAQADVALTCGVGENCTNGVDDNGNNLVDCKDLASCCGDVACGEVCDGADNDCDGKIDDGCDDDADGFCDKDMTVEGTPAVCAKGNLDCNDAAGTINPGAQEICLNNKDDNCNGVGDEENAAGCINYWVDLDSDGFGAGVPKCLCQPSGSYKATKGGDCGDANPKVNPSMLEVCGNNLDDDCSGTQNDLNAQGCSEFYTDTDGDAWGVLPKKCLCVGAGLTTATKPGDCNDLDKQVNPDLLETCDNQDNNCNNVIDEGCDDDQDGYCDNLLGYVSIGASKKLCGQGTTGQTVTVKCEAGASITAVDFASYGTPSGMCGVFQTGTCHAPSSLQAVKDLCLGKNSCDIVVNATTFGGDPCAGTTKILDVQVTCTGQGGVAPNSCPKGAGDSDDLDPKINPEGKEICDNKDNNSDGKVDEGCDDDDDDFCDVNMIVVGAPLTCTKGPGDCNDGNKLVNPGVAENCDTSDDDDCDGNNNELDAQNCTVFFFDGDSDAYGTKQFKCFCAPIGSFKAKKTADCDDTKPSINPGAVEACDNIDNNCDSLVDNGCDDDADGYCDSSVPLAQGGANVCPNGGNDCVDSDPAVNPSKAEVCGNGIDDNCNGTQNDGTLATGAKTYYADGDQDTFGSNSSKVLCDPTGSFQATQKGDCDDGDTAINPLATELCDNKDNDCDALTDEGCDDDDDNYCDSKMQLVGVSGTCTAGGGDCDDTKSAINPGIPAEICDDVDDNCSGVVDDGCDDDKDGYCDAAATVKNPLPKICPKGVGDCDDLNNYQNPGAQEICGNSLDDNCNGSQNDPNALNCKKFYFDGDEDKYGLNIAQCLCSAQGSYTAPAGDDCNDGDPAIKPGAAEICGDGKDNNCNLSENDENATGCKTFYYDGDLDKYGLSALQKCLCVGEAGFVATSGGDCNDTAKAVNPGIAEQCDDTDNNCDAKVDEGCNDDGDTFCDGKMTTVGFPNACSSGGGDCDDAQIKANPGEPEICDNLDNNCNGNTDEGCDDDNDDYCDKGMVTTTATTCTKGGGDCVDDNNVIHPGMTEQCATFVDDNCNGNTNDIGANGCTNFGFDLDADTFMDKAIPAKCMCKAEGQYTGSKTGDCDDKNDLVNPSIPEICDGIDNNCDGVIDEQCDKDKDGYCDAGKTTIGKPYTCGKGGGDCNDNVVTINPGAPEVCGNAVDENCDADLNGIDAQGCSKFYLDADNDSWGVNVSQCLCVPKGAYKVDGTKLGDCDDTSPATNPAAPEVCGDGLDNNCNGTQNDVNAVNCAKFYVDGDKDGYGQGAGQCLCFAQGSFVTPTPGDCVDNNADVNPGELEKCDGLDNNCDTAVDKGCDDDVDGYCDSAMTLVGTPAICPKGGGDCNDTSVAIKPGQIEVCDNVDTDCNTVIDNGCDDDKDGYCDKALTVVGTPTICNKGGNDCDDGANAVNPGKAEICDDLDNNCNSSLDEGCDDDDDNYCDTGMSVVGIPSLCPLGPGDCADTTKTINPGAAETCDGADNNCVGGVDETCKDSDGDGYCVGNVPVSAACPKGGQDCNDSSASVNPGAVETCATEGDDNCDGVTNAVGATACKNFYTDADGDGFGTGAATCQCVQSAGKTALTNTDCNDTNAKVNPTAVEVCDGLDNDCAGGVDGGCDDDADGHCDGSLLIASTATCAKTAKPAVGATAPGDDCNDASNAVFPSATEKCDNLDNNCNTQVDEGCDDDNDNYCESGLTVVGTPSTCTAGGGDCNDGDTLVNPSKTENCTTAYDDNCDGALTAMNAVGCTNYYFDGDSDGWGTAAFQCHCAPSGSYKATQKVDCDDTNGTVYPSASAEICDGKDNNCNSVTDEGCDDDKDGYCTSAMTVSTTASCPKTVITAGKGDDCDPTNKFVNPGAAEICDDVNNNCNASTDEGCNKDGDQYCDGALTVVGTPAVCIKGGGDCNDADLLVNPATQEKCNGKDDNCNKLTDEAGAAGSVPWYYDGDQDGASIGSFQLLCGATGLYSRPVNDNDCNDACPTCKPGLAEMCDGKDNDCDNLVDEGCNADGDGYCTAGMTTVGTPTVCPKGGGDCNDGNGSIYPTKAESCNNVDDNCNNTVDENASDQCSAVSNAIVGCVAGQCVVKSCLTGFYNLNGSLSDGCECNGNDQYEPNNSCSQAYVVSANVVDTSGGTKELVTGRLVDTNDEDWYAFYGSDSGDGGYGVCDKYNVRVVFTQNPGGLAFEITRGGCPNGSNTVCCGQTDFNWFTNFKGAQNGDPSRQWSEWGECPCQTNNDYARGHTGWNIPPGYPGGGGPYCKDYNSGYVCFPTGYYYTRCQDNSAWYYVRVYKTGGAPTCSNYSLEMSNGVYGAPGYHLGYKPN